METPRRSVIVGALVTVGVVSLTRVFRSPTAAPPEYLTVPRASTGAVAFDPSPYDRVCHRFVDSWVWWTMPV